MISKKRSIPDKKVKDEDCYPVFLNNSDKIRSPDDFVGWITLKGFSQIEGHTWIPLFDLGRFRKPIQFKIERLRIKIPGEATKAILKPKKCVILPSNKHLREVKNLNIFKSYEEPFRDSA